MEEKPECVLSPRKVTSKYPTNWRVSNANLWLSQRYRENPLIADDILRACEGSNVNPYVMFLVGSVTSNFYSKQDVDFFACGIGGTLEDQVVNASIKYSEFENVGQLNLNELQLRQFDLLAISLYRFMIAMADRTPKPLPVPPEPKPEPKPVPPKPPTGWWDCPKCRMNNPPKGTQCLRCFTRRLGTEPEPKPKEPEVPSKPVSWKKSLTLVVSILAAAGFVIKMFLPGVAGQIFDVVINILQALLG